MINPIDLVQILITQTKNPEYLLTILNGTTPQVVPVFQVKGVWGYYEGGKIVNNNVTLTDVIGDIEAINWASNLSLDSLKAELAQGRARATTETQEALDRLEKELYGDNNGS